MISKAQMQIFSIICVFLSLGYLCEAGITRTEGPLKCHICDQDTCTTFDRKAQPQECQADMLDQDNVGPSALSEMSYIPFSKLDQGVPLFSCLKIDAYDRKGNLNVLRKCQLRLAANASCDVFYRNFAKDKDGPYTNATCYLCDIDGCNGANFLHTAVFPFFIVSCILGFLLK